MTTHPSTIDFEQAGIGTALARNRLAVPLNQREYSWEESHILDLFHDLANAIDSVKSTYFLGTIVLSQREDGTFEVADGQQRLATTTILLAAIRDYFEERHDALLVQDVNAFLFTIVRETREFNPRLRLNVDDNEFFKNHILAKKGEAARKAAKPQKPSHFRIEKAGSLAAQHVGQIIAPHGDPNRIDRLNTWVTYIQDSAQVIVLKVPDDLNAYVMFETLNDRGLRTSQADLVKNHLFALADNRLSEAQHKWASMNGALETLEQDDITITYLTHLIISKWGHVRERAVFEVVKERMAAKQQVIEFLDALAEGANHYVAIQTPTHPKWNDYHPHLTHLIISKWGHVRERAVFEVVKERMAAKQQVIEFLDALAEGANHYVAIQTPTHPKWNDYHPHIREHISTLVLLGVSPLRPLALAISGRFNKKQAELAFRQLVFWSVRYLVAGIRSGRAVELIHNVAQEISSGRVGTASKLADHMAPLLLSDPAFKEQFAAYRVSKSGLARYYLRALEYKLQGNATPEFVPNEDIVINLEHVLPGHLGQGWPDLDSAVAHTYHNRLGNMVLLRADLNSVIGNRRLEEKKPTLAKSTFLLTKEVAQQDEWGPKEITSRQERMAELAVKVWPLRA